jgi:hypothetical protein
MIQKTKLKKVFHDQGIQINIEALNVLDDHVNRMANLWATRCKIENVKRLTPDLIWVPLGRLNQ